LISERSCNPFVVPLMFTSPLYPFMRPLQLAHPAAGKVHVTGLSCCGAERRLFRSDGLQTLGNLSRRRNGKL